MQRLFKTKPYENRCGSWIRTNGLLVMSQVR